MIPSDLFEGLAPFSVEDKKWPIVQICQLIKETINLNKQT